MTADRTANVTHVASMLGFTSLSDGDFLTCTAEQLVRFADVLQDIGRGESYLTLHDSCKREETSEQMLTALAEAMLFYFCRAHETLRGGEGERLC